MLSLKIRRACVLSLFSVLYCSVGFSQFSNLTNDTSTPIAGAGHDYRQLLSEIVNPANGSVSVRISVPVAKGRGITVPFSFDYDSSGTHHLTIDTGQGHFISGSGYLYSGGWSYGIPMLTYVGANYLTSTGVGGISCPGAIGYMFTDSLGQRRSFKDLAYFLSAPAGCPGPINYSSNDGYQGQLTSGGGDDGVIIADPSGTVYTFGGTPHPAPAPNNSVTLLPTSIEDSNGNIITVADPGSGAFTFADDTGRNAFSSSGFGVAGNTYNLAVSGLSEPYHVTWGSATSAYSIGSGNPSGNDCRGINSESDTQAVVTSITLPNGQSYTFQYDGTYGLLGKITYPNGAYSRYTWGLNHLSDYASWTSADHSQACGFTFDTPTVQKRFVSFDGVNETLEEDYSYSTTWGSGTTWSQKTTTVNTTVRTVQNGTFATIGTYSTNYTYGSYTAPQNPDDQGPAIGNQIPLESSIVYKDYSGSTLKTVAKSWQDPYLLMSQTTTLDNGQTSAIAYSYNTNGQLTGEVEDGYGSGSPGSAMRQTTVSYQAFNPGPVFPGYSAILDRPCKRVTADGPGNRVAQTDYLYDGGATVCGTAGSGSTAAISEVVGHDETNYGASATASRGNVTQQVQQNVSTGTSISQFFTYDETGQTTSSTDPNGNLTGYSYLDNYASGFGSPAGQTNAYLTTLTMPTTSSSNHVQSYAYRYADGQLATSSDQNGKTTSYAYDPLGRLTQTNYPNGGLTTVTYNDAGTNPSVVTAQLIDNTPRSVMNKSVMDGAGHVIQTQLLSDPSGTVFTDTTYDGSGQTASVSNPYRSTSDSTYGVTSYQHDALGRVVATVLPDGAESCTTYIGNTSTSVDPATVARSMVSDALGRITGVTEDPTNPAGCSGTITRAGSNLATTYTYDTLDDLTAVNQSGQSRTFHYDSLQRLTSATNPESGTVQYTYDNAGNLWTRTDARQIKTTYSYDALNRITGKTYTNDPNGTSPVSYGYDDPSITNSKGHLTSVANANSSTAYTKFDEVGNVSSSPRSRPASGIRSRIPTTWQARSRLRPIPQAG